MYNNKRLIQAMLRDNFSCFVAKAFSTVLPAAPYLHNWHLDIINNKLEQIQKREITRLIINIPPRYLKSICVSVAWPAWLLGQDPTKRIMVASYSQALSNKHSQDCCRVSRILTPSAINNSKHFDPSEFQAF